MRKSLIAAGAVAALLLYTGKDEISGKLGEAREGLKPAGLPEIYKPDRSYLEEISGFEMPDPLPQFSIRRHLKRQPGEDEIVRMAVSHELGDIFEIYGQCKRHMAALVREDFALADQLEKALDQALVRKNYETVELYRKLYLQATERYGSAFQGTEEHAEASVHMAVWQIDLGLLDSGREVLANFNPELLHINDSNSYGAKKLIELLDKQPALSQSASRQRAVLEKKILEFSLAELEEIKNYNNLTALSRKDPSTLVYNIPRDYDGSVQASLEWSVKHIKNKNTDLYKKLAGMADRVPDPSELQIHVDAGKGAILISNLDSHEMFRYEFAQVLYDTRTRTPRYSSPSARLLDRYFAEDRFFPRYYYGDRDITRAIFGIADSTDRDIFKQRGGIDVVVITAKK